MTVPMQVEEIGIRFTTAAFHGKRDQNHRKSLVGFICDPRNRKVLFPDITDPDLSDRQGHETAIEYFRRFWSPDRTCTAIITSISMDDQQRYLVRPVRDGAATAGYGTGRQIPGFHCLLQNGYFLAIGFESGLWPDSNVEQIVLAGPVYAQVPPAPGEVLDKTRPPKSLPADVLENISNLESKRLLVSRKVENWFAFLDWSMDVVRQRQVACRYDSVEIDKSNQSLRFNVSASPEQWQKIKEVRSFSVDVLPVSASKEPEQWLPVVSDPRGVSLGELSVPTRQLDKLLAGNSTEQISCALEVQPNAEAWEKCLGQIPELGFLVSQIFANVIPLQRQRTALYKLVKGEYVNPYLPDFLFDASKARTPDAPVLGLEPEDAEYLFDELGARHLNDQQRLAIAKMRACPDLVTLEAAPGTGKTETLAHSGALFVKSGQRVLVTSQAKVAVTKMLDSLPPDPRIRFVQICRREKQADSPFSEEAAVHTWLGHVHDACKEQLTREQNLVKEREQIEHIWPQFADLVQNHKEHVRGYAAAEKSSKEMECKATELGDVLKKQRRREAVLSAADVSLEQTTNQLNSCSVVVDHGEWVKVIDSPDRGGLFKPIRSWQRSHSPPRSVQRLLVEPEPTYGKDPLDTTRPSTRKGLLGRFHRQSLWEKLQSSLKGPNPNWAVLWIDSCALLNRLQDLSGNLPGLLELCLEAERLCAVSARVPSDVGDAAWAAFTKNLAGALQSSGQVVADVLAVSDIATSLRPKRSFAAKLTKARALLQDVLQHIPSLADDLQKTLTRVADESAKYIDSRLRAIGEQIGKSQSDLHCLELQQSRINESLSSIGQELRQVESDWSETIESLPCALRSRIAPEVPPISSKGCRILNKAKASYMQDTEEAKDHYELWGSVRQRWIRRLQRTTEADSSRLTPLYLKHCNVVGATCSWCGNRQRFLSRDECQHFDVGIVDEVSKATPAELLMPALLVEKIILSGDYRQLPPTFKEGRRLERSYDELDEIGVDIDQVARFRDMVTASLFKQLYHESPDAIKQHLTIEYRFPVQILELVNQFNDPPLQCGLDSSDERFNHGLLIKTSSGDFLTPQNHVLWVNTSRDGKGRRVRERQAGSSKANDIEAQAVVKLIRLFNEAAKRAGMAAGSLEIGVITFYGAQVRLLSNMLSKMKSADKKFLRLRASTVDDFQGMEQEIVILSMVRAKPGRIGKFTRQYERVHVAMSRAKKLLVVLGSVDTFNKVEVPVLAADGETINRKCYANIVDIVKKYGGMRSIRDF